MSPHGYTEDQLVERPAIGLFASMGWETVSALEETFGPGGTLGRETKGEVVLLPRLRAALGRLNPGMPEEAIQTAVDALRGEEGGQGAPGSAEATSRAGLAAESCRAFAPR